MRWSRNIILLAGLFVFAGIMHFVIPMSYLSIMPPWIPYPLEAVYVSGVAEIVGGLALLVPQLRRMAGISLIVLLIAVFPANVQMLINAVSSNATALHQAGLFLRLPLQPLLIVWVYRSTIPGPVARHEDRQPDRTIL